VRDGPRPGISGTGLEGGGIVQVVFTLEIDLDGILSAAGCPSFDKGAGCLLKLESGNIVDDVFRGVQVHRSIYLPVTGGDAELCLYAIYPTQCGNVLMR
jgi:hypothetical protein